MAESYRPIFGRVLLERKVLSKVGSIIIPLDQQKRQAVCRGKVAALGCNAGWARSYSENGQEIMKKEINVGDEVSFGRHAGAWLDSSYGVTENANDDAPYFLCADLDILAVIEKGE